MTQNYSNDSTAITVRDNTKKYLNFSYKTTFVLLVIIVMMLISLAHLEVRKAKIEEQRAYVISVWIASQEDYLLYSYGMLPIDVGLKEIRDTWMENPCYQTATLYADALEEVINDFEEGHFQDVPEVELFINKGMFV